MMTPLCQIEGGCYPDSFAPSPFRVTIRSVLTAISTDDNVRT